MSDLSPTYPTHRMYLVPVTIPTRAQYEVMALADLKQRARSALHGALHRGKIIKPTECSRCGKSPPRRDLHGHHHDYTKPLDVEWVCQKCHQAEDGSGWKP